ncbi:AAA family ATPase [Arthrobacter mobilis]|uniref:AAA family ATPase n=1 Tax=Arthrobacter mobilis TaxID=2724944 RepID=A0A7X6K7U1_9MICC|nr:AAA family ATPase [Arthrobacter mobilis]NKX56721.1 AAA family ATPase [Arthrobacter mobilis]
MRFLLVTDDAGFEHRVRQAISGGLPGSVQTLKDVQLPPTPAEMLHYVVGEVPEVILLGPGVRVDEALTLAAVFDVQHPEISLVLVAEVEPELALAAMRAGIRDVLEPAADPDTIRVLLERASQSSASRRRNLLPPALPNGPGGRILTVTSPKGGVGKTTVATNLAIGLGQVAPMSTVLVDLDAQFGDVATALRLEPAHTLVDAVTGAAAQDPMVLKAFLSVHPASIYALCAPASPAEGDRISGESIAHMLKQLASEFQYVVVDTAPGLGEQTLTALEAATDAVFLCGMDVPSVRGLRKELEVLGQLNLVPENRHIVVNTADRHSGLTVQDIEATLGAPVDVVVPRSRAVAYSTNKGEPLLQDGSRDPAAKALRQLVERFDPARADQRRALHRRAVLR